MFEWIEEYRVCERQRRPASMFKPVRIGADVWIDHNSIVLSGIEIGDGVAIGAGWVLTKDVPPYAVL